MTNEDESPYAPPQHPVEPSHERVENELTRVVLRAAKGSCYLALILYVLGFVSTLSPQLYALFVLIDCAAFLLGGVGIIGGIKCGAPVAIRIGMLGAVFSGLPLVFIAWRVVR